MAVDETRLHELLGKMLGDLGAVINGALVVIGDRLGLYRLMAENGPLTSAELAEKSHTDERYVREWLAAQSASDYICYDPKNEKFHLSDEQKMIFADENSPVLMTGGFYSAASVYHDELKMVEAFQSGKGIPWGDHHSCLFCGTAKFFKPGYDNHLIQEWIPSLEGLAQRLESGAKVADVGCGFGISTTLMAQAFPNSEVMGFDIHPDSVEHGNSLAREKGLKNLKFQLATAKDFPGEDYDLVTFFDCLHDMGDPEGALKHVKEVMKPDGHLMLIEPLAGDRLTDNLNPVGRIYYGFSTVVCTPASKSQEVGLALGAQAGEKRLRDVATGAGFSRFQRTMATPFNMVLEARP